MSKVLLPNTAATGAQQRYATILLNEAGHTGLKLQAFLDLRFHKSYLSDLTKQECSDLISELLGEEDA